MNSPRKRPSPCSPLKEPLCFFTNSAVLVATVRNNFLSFSSRNFYSQVMYFTIISTENQIISKMFFPFPILVVLTTKRLMQIWLRNAHGTQKMEHTVHLEHFTLSDIIAIIQIHDPNNIIFLATIISSAFMKNKIATVTENKITIPNFLSPIQMTNGENSVGTSL